METQCSSKFRFALKEEIALRVRDDRVKPRHLDVVIYAAEMFRNELVRKFHQQVGGLIDGEILGILRANLDVVVGKMKVAAQQELRFLAHLFLELGKQVCG